jgi:uncharacterized protein YjbI with pentapeptide repeats
MLSAMEFRKLANGRSVQRPALDKVDLAPGTVSLRGDFEHELVLIDGDDYSGVRGEGTIAQSILLRVNLSTAQLGPLSLSDARLDTVDLSNASISEVTIQRTELLRCRAVGLRLSLTYANDLYVEGCRFDYAILQVDRTKRVTVFVDCSFREATITGDLSDVVFSGCELGGVEFDVRRANRCDLHSSRLVGSRGLLSLRGAEISADQAVAVADQLATEAGLIVCRAS